jgi:hypothetical protein
MTEGNKSGAYRTGWWVFIALAAVTGFEFWLSNATQGTLIYLTFTSLLKAGLIVYYFMHVTQLWQGRVEQE